MAEKRDKWLSIRVTEAERELITRMAETVDLSASEFMRVMLASNANEAVANWRLKLTELQDFFADLKALEMHLREREEL